MNNIVNVVLPPMLADCGSSRVATLRTVRALLREAARTGPQVVSVDLRHVIRCGAGFISILVEVQSSLRRAGGRLELRHVRREVCEVLECCGLGSFVGQQAMR